MIKLFKNITKKELLFVILAILFVVIQVNLDLKLPDYMSNITKLVQTEGTVKEIFNLGLKMLIIAFLSLGTSIIVGFFATYLASSFGEKTRGKIYRKVFEFSESEIKKFFTKNFFVVHAPEQQIFFDGSFFRVGFIKFWSGSHVQSFLAVNKIFVVNSGKRRGIFAVTCGAVRFVADD